MTVHFQEKWRLASWISGEAPRSEQRSSSRRPSWARKSSTRLARSSGAGSFRLPARQSFPTLFRQNGSVWVTDRDLLKDKNLIVGLNAYGVQCDDRESFDIDTRLDPLVADVMMKQKEERAGCTTE